MSEGIGRGKGKERRETDIVEQADEALARGESR